MILAAFWTWLYRLIYIKRVNSGSWLLSHHINHNHSIRSVTEVISKLFSADVDAVLSCVWPCSDPCNTETRAISSFSLSLQMTRKTHENKLCGGDWSGTMTTINSGGKTARPFRMFRHAVSGPGFLIRQAVMAAERIRTEDAVKGLSLTFPPVWNL